MGRVADSAVRCKVRILKPLHGVFSEYQPVVGGVYDAIYNESKSYSSKQSKVYICIIDVKDKKICLRNGEYEIIED